MTVITYSCSEETQEASRPRLLNTTTVQNPTHTASATTAHAHCCMPHMYLHGARLAVVQLMRAREART